MQAGFVRLASSTTSGGQAPAVSLPELCICDVTKGSTIDRADWHGDVPFYPASVVKLYMMAEVFHQKKEAEPEVARALGEMIRLSDNDATAFLLDIVSDTCPGPNLEGRALAKFMDKRRVVNRWL